MLRTGPPSSIRTGIDEALEAHHRRPLVLLPARLLLVQRQARWQVPEHHGPRGPARESWRARAAADIGGRTAEELLTDRASGTGRR